VDGAKVKVSLEVEAETDDSFTQQTVRTISENCRTLRARNCPQRMAYIDLFAGPGRCDDQSKSTPLLVLETIFENLDLASRMVTLFNDKDAANIESLKKAIAEVPGIDELKCPPDFYNEEVGDEIAKMFSSKPNVPMMP
jgi:three-Cys-motif partner protein